MSEMNRMIRYWGKGVLENIGVTLGVTVVLMLFMATGISSLDKVVEMILYSFPFYLFVVGAFVEMITLVGFFQSHISMLLSFNNRRKMIILGVAGYAICYVAILACITWVLGAFTGGAADEGLRSMIGLVAGFLLAASGVAMIFGAICAKFGKIGLILLTAFMACIGGVIGFTVSMTGLHMFGKGEVVVTFSISNITMILIGLAVFVVGTLLSLALFRKAEVRA